MGGYGRNTPFEGILLIYIKVEICKTDASRQAIQIITLADCIRNT